MRGKESGEVWREEEGGRRASERYPSSTPPRGQAPKKKPLAQKKLKKNLKSRGRTTLVPVNTLVYSRRRNKRVSDTKKPEKSRERRVRYRKYSGI